jgi:Fe-S cluster biosynthesis and repair protein YggX
MVRGEIDAVLRCSASTRREVLSPPRALPDGRFHRLLYLRNFELGTLEDSMARTVHCVKLGREAEGLDFPPYPGDLGKRIYETVSKEAWQQWLRHQTMLVNENRLSLADPRARKWLAEQMEKHFFGEGAERPAGYVPPKEP